MIGFIGAPWTLLIYMLGIKESKKGVNYKKIKEKEFEVNLILDKLHEYLCVHIENQINAGADVIQVFDSWAGLIAKDDIPNYCYIPNLKIVDFFKENKIPVICFPKGINKNFKEFNSVVNPDGINLDYDIDPIWAKQNLSNVVLQGGLDPKLLLLNNQDFLSEAKKYLDIFKGLPYIFNLGHGCFLKTDPDNIEKLVKFYREFSNGKRSPKIKFGKTGVLLINLGTPDSTNWWDIRKYLKEFLSIELLKLILGYANYFKFIYSYFQTF